MPTFKSVQNKKGFTLLELIVVIAILGVVTIALSSLLMYGNKTTAIGNNQFAVQSDARLAMDKIIQELRFAKELSIIDAGVAETEKSTTTYNYIYIKNGRIYKSLYDSSSATRSDTILSETVLDSTSQFVKVAGTIDTLNIQIGAKKGDQEFAIDSNLKLVNLSLMKPVVGIQGSGTTLGVRFKVTELPTSYVYTFTFKTGGGSTVPSVTQASGTTITPPADPTRTGYTFAGWVPAIPSTMPVGGGSVTAQWTVLPDWYTIVFDSSGGTPVSSIFQKVGTVVTAPANPTKNGFVFTGWDHPVPGIMPLGGDTLTAQWSMLSADATLKSATLSIGTLSPSFSPGTQSYAIIANKNASITITVAKNDPKATIDRTSATVDKHANTADFTVTAENGDQKVYRFVFGALNDDASLMSVNLSKWTLTPVFSATVHDYTIKGKAGDIVVITPNVSDPFATVSPTSANVSMGSPLASFVVTAQDGITQEVYTFTYVVMNSDATLSSIGLSKGTLMPAFNASVASYTVKGSSTDNITVTPVKNNPLATISPISAILNKTNLSASFTVTAEDGTTEIYTVGFILMSSDNTLASIGLSKGTLIPNFDPAVLSYTVKGLSTDNITVTPVKNAIVASVAPTFKTISNANKVASFIVTAEDGTQKTYTVTFALKSSDANLSNIGLAGNSKPLSPTFSASTISYTVKGKVTESITLTPVNSDANAVVSPTTAVITNASKVATFTVTAEDGTIKTYTVTFVLMSSDATLKTAVVSAGNTITPAFDSNVTNYTVGNDNNITVTVSVNSPFADVDFTSQVVKKNNPSSITFTVTAEDGTIKTYTFTHN